MNVAREKRSQGFSLIELIIVVVIIGILAAIAVPRMSRGSEGAADAKLTADLAVLRNAIDLYNVEHPGKLPTVGSVADQLITYTDLNGVTNKTKTGNFIYGPYVRKMPKLSVGNHVGLNTVVTGGAPGSMAGGWWYDPSSGNIIANLDGSLTVNQDVEGVSYDTY